MPCRRSVARWLHALALLLAVAWWGVAVSMGTVGCGGVTIKRTMPKRVDVEFATGGETVRGWLYLPVTTAGSRLPPGIVMAPGFSGTKETNYQFFAEEFANQGLAVLLFDYPRFGASGGEPRGEVDPAAQVQAYRDGISFLASRSDVDGNRIGLWGGSYSGGHVLVAASLEPRVKCLVAMTPFISGSYYLERFPPQIRTFLEQQFQKDGATRAQGGPPAMIPVATPDASAFAAISSPNAWSFIQSFQPYAPSYVNSVTLKSLQMQLSYEPGTSVPRIGSIPKLFIIARKDEVVPESLILEAFTAASEPKQLAYIEGHHFSPYMEGRPDAIRAAASFFTANL